MVEITVNGETKHFENAVTIGQLLELLALKDLKGVAVAVNEMVVPRSAWSSRELCSADNIIIIKATAGG